MGHILLLRFSVSYDSSWTRAISNRIATRGIGCFSTTVRCSRILYILQAHGARIMCARSLQNGISAQGYRMKTETFVRRSRIDAPAAEVYAWHALPGALERLTPPGERVKIIDKIGGIERGARVVLQFGRWPFLRQWVAEHRDCEAGRYFSDVQISGPFAYWKHTHTFDPDGPSACFLEDRVEYALPFGVPGRWFAGWYVRRKLVRLFEYRHEVTAREVIRKRTKD
jgi:ligand-binding SRPBCC domain-containing protein